SILGGAGTGSGASAADAVDVDARAKSRTGATPARMAASGGVSTAATTSWCGGSRSAVRGGSGLLIGESNALACASSTAETGFVTTAGSNRLIAVTEMVSTCTSRDGRATGGVAASALGPGAGCRTVAGGDAGATRFVRHQPKPIERIATDARTAAA